MAETQVTKSILAADFGSVNTRLVLIDRVAGTYRLVARASTRTTDSDPLRDVTAGLNRAILDLVERTGRQMLDGVDIIKPETQTGVGVDRVVVTASAGRPLRVVLVGLMPTISLASGQHVLEGSYVEMVETLSGADILTAEQRLNRILRCQPDLIAIVGGTDAGAEAPILELVDLVRDAVRIAPNPPQVLYAGNRALQAVVRERLGDVAHLLQSDNVRPGLADEQIGPAQLELAAAYNAFRMSGSGFATIAEISDLGILPTAQSFTTVVRYLGEVKRRETPGVLAVDVGSGTTTVAASIQQQPFANVRTDLGLGHSAAGLLDATTGGNIRRWLTYDASDARIADYAVNKTMRPATVPQNARDLELEYALAREAIRVTMAQVRTYWQQAHPEAPALPRLSPLIGAGAALTNAPSPGYAALVLLDALQPSGVTDLWLDPAGIIPALGALAYVAPAAVVQMLETGDLTPLGTAICVDGKPALGKGSVQVRIKLDDGQVIKHKVSGGMVWAYPLPPGQHASVRLSLSRGLSVNGKRRLRLTLTGGAAGLIIDARGRPLPLLRDAEARAMLYPAWVAGVQGEELAADEGAPDWGQLSGAARVETEEVAAHAPSDDGQAEAAPARSARRRRRGRRRRQEEAPADDLDGLSPIGADLSGFDIDDFEFDEVGSSAPAEPEPAPAPARRSGRRTRQAEPAEPADADILDELRQATGADDEAPRRRRGRRR
ncbi:MAG: glutamate mutase L [Anaerolineae bacterium]|nr:glutamate mutase L [Anaerolineae bacterium]